MDFAQFENRFSVRVMDNKYYLVDIFKDVEFTVFDLHELIKLEEKLGGKKLPVLVVCPSSVTTNVELMRELAKNENNPYSSADGFVINSMSQKILANFYLRINIPERPTKFFTNQQEAETWLNQFI